MKFTFSLLLVSVLFSSSAFAQEKKFEGESEASSVVISGNSNNETYSAKTKNTYYLGELDLVSVFGKYLRATTGGTESNKAWEAGLRYEHIFTKDQLSGFVQHKAEHDPYNGVFIQRDSTDLGAKYILIKNESFNWFVELGYRSENAYLNMENSRETIGYIRAYTEAGYQITPTASTKLWVEHLGNLKRSQNQQNAELSLSVAINTIFSLKSAYLLNRNEAIAAPLKKETTTWTTALVAKY